MACPPDVGAVEPLATRKQSMAEVTQVSVQIFKRVGECVGSFTDASSFRKWRSQTQKQLGGEVAVGIGTMADQVFATAMHRRAAEFKTRKYTIKLEHGSACFRHNSMQCHSVRRNPVPRYRLT